jgi:hypothetical protein
MNRSFKGELDVQQDNMTFVDDGTESVLYRSAPACQILADGGNQLTAPIEGCDRALWQKNAKAKVEAKGSKRN